MTTVPISTDSEQCYRTPAHIYDHYSGRFRYVVDLAADKTNAKCPVFVTEAVDSLGAHVDWARLVDECRNEPGPALFKNPDNGTRAAGWLNPTFCNAGKWAEKMAASAPRLAYGDVLTMLCLSSSIGTEWYKDVAPLCMTELITPRFSYEHPDPERAARDWAARKLGRRPEDWKPAAPAGSMVLLFSRLTHERATAPTESLRIRHVEIRKP